MACLSQLQALGGRTGGLGGSPCSCEHGCISVQMVGDAPRDARRGKGRGAACRVSDRWISEFWRSCLRLPCRLVKVGTGGTGRWGGCACACARVRG